MTVSGVGPSYSRQFASSSQGRRHPCSALRISSPPLQDSLLPAHVDVPSFSSSNRKEHTFYQPGFVRVRALPEMALFTRKSPLFLWLLRAAGSTREPAPRWSPPVVSCLSGCVRTGLSPRGVNSPSGFALFADRSVLCAFFSSTCCWRRPTWRAGGFSSKIPYRKMNSSRSTVER